MNDDTKKRKGIGTLRLMEIDRKTLPLPLLLRAGTAPGRDESVNLDGAYCQLEWMSLMLKKPWCLL